MTETTAPTTTGGAEGAAAEHEQQHQEQQQPTQPQQRHEPPEHQEEQQHDRPTELTVEGYELEVDPNISQGNREQAEGYARDMGALAKHAGISQDAAQLMYNAMVDVALVETSGEIDLTNRQACESLLHARYGEDTADIINLARRAVRRLGPEVRDYLDRTNLGNHPAVVRMLAEYQLNTFNMSKETATKALAQVRADKRFWSGDPVLVDRARVLSAILARGEGEELERPEERLKSATERRAEAVDAEINKLRTDPAYFDSSRPNHKTVVARVRELYAQRYDS